MHWILDFIIYHKRGSSLFLTIFMSLFMLSFKNSMKQDFAQKLSITVFYPFQKTISFTKNFRKLSDENRVLDSTVAKMKTDNLLLREYINDISTITEDNSKIDTLNYELVSAKVVARDPSFLYRTVVVDAGKVDGIKKDMPVVSSKGVVGRVIKVLDNCSLVQLLRSTDEFISIKHKKSSSIGIIHPSIEGNLLVNMKRHITIEVGDTVLSSGYGGIYPGGLLVGFVSNIKSGESLIYNNVEVTSSVNYSKLRTLYIIKANSNWQSFQSQVDSLIHEEL